MLRLTGCLILGFAAVARAEPSADLHLRAPTEALQELRMSSRAERRTMGLVLFGWGTANAVAGGVIAAVGHEHESWLAAGVTAASFGVINALLTPSLLDLSGARRRQILADRPSSAHDFARVREAELVSELKSGQTFAFNFGLDVAYISAGVLLYIIGRVRSPATGWEEASGLTIAGLFLLGFDLLEWLNTSRRATALRALDARD
jgi:hypothetical protein